MPHADEKKRDCWARRERGSPRQPRGEANRRPEGRGRRLFAAGAGSAVARATPCSYPLAATVVRMVHRLKNYYAAFHWKPKAVKNLPAMTMRPSAKKRTSFDNDLNRIFEEFGLVAPTQRNDTGLQAYRIFRDHQLVARQRAARTIQKHWRDALRNTHDGRRVHRSYVVVHGPRSYNARQLLNNDGNEVVSWPGTSDKLTRANKDQEAGAVRQRKHARATFPGQDQVLPETDAGGPGCFRQGPKGVPAVPRRRMDRAGHLLSP